MQISNTCALKDLDREVGLDDLSRCANVCLQNRRKHNNRGRTSGMGSVLPPCLRVFHRLYLSKP